MSGISAQQKKGPRKEREREREKKEREKKGAMIEKQEVKPHMKKLHVSEGEKKKRG
jgi:hypothetical protein